MLSNNIVIAASFGRKVATEQFWKQKFDTFERSERCREFEMNYWNVIFYSPTIYTATYSATLLLQRRPLPVSTVPDSKFIVFKDGFNFQIVVFLSLMVSDQYNVPQINSALLSAVSSPLLRRRGDSTWVRNPMTTVPGGQKTQSRHSPKDPY